MSGLSVFDVIIPGYAFRHLFPNDDGERTERRAQEQEAQRAREHAAVLQQVREDNERRAAQAEERMQRAEESRLKEMRERIESESRMQREPRIAFVGMTNAGKSSLINALCGTRCEVSTVDTVWSAPRATPQSQ